VEARACTRAQAAPARSTGRFCPDTVADPSSFKYEISFWSRIAARYRRSAQAGSRAIATRRTRSASPELVSCPAAGSTSATSRSACSDVRPRQPSANTIARPRSITPAPTAAATAGSAITSSARSSSRRAARRVQRNSARISSTAESKISLRPQPAAPGPHDGIGARVASSAIVAHTAACW